MKHFYYNSKFINKLKCLCLLLLFITGYANAQTNVPEINIKQGTADKANGSSYAFADQNVNTFSNAVTFTIENNGTANLTILDITLSGDNADQFTLVKNVTPTAVTAGGNTTFTINFSPKNNVPSAKNAVITIVNDDEDESTYTINLTGKAVILNANITSFTPASAAVGATVTINGVNLINTTNVSFNGVPASSFAVVSDVQVTAVIPSEATNGPISLINPVGEVTSSGTIKILPTITGFSPAFGPVDNTTVTITGTGFIGATSVKFYNNITAVDFKVNSSTQIIAKVPAGTTLGPISVTTPGGTATSTQAFAPPPTITSLSATFGIIGNQVAINGTNFPNTATTIIKFTGKDGVNTVTATKTGTQTSTRLNVIVPIGAITGPITVTTIAGSVSSSVFSITNTTYTWNSATGDWTEPTNWTPSRTSPSANDILQFDGSVVQNPIVTLNFASTETIGYLGLSNAANVTFTVADDKTLNIANNVASGADFVVAAGCNLTVTNSTAGADLTINMTTTSGQTGSVAGVITFQGTGTANHQLLANTSGLTFAAGGRFIAESNLSGSPFGTAPKSAVTFANGSFYNNRSLNSLPFGAVSPNAVVIFNSGSTYIHEVNSAPDIIDRTYGTFIINVNAFNQTITGTGALRILNNLTLTAPTPTGTPSPIFNLNLAGNITISGILTVSSGTLSFNPVAASTLTVTNNVVTNNSGIINFNSSYATTVSLGGSVTLNGTGRLNLDNSSEVTTVRLTGANKTISGTGTFFLGSRANMSIESNASVTLSKSITGAGTLTVNGTVRTANTNGLTPLLSTLTSLTINPGSTVVYNGTGTQTISAIDYANLTISGPRAGKVITLPTTLRISGSFSPSATNAVYDNIANTTIEFNGGEQTIPAILTYAYNNLVISGTGNKVLGANIRVSKNLKMAGKNLDASDYNLILEGTATITGETANSYVIGNLSTTRNITAAAGSNFGGMGISIGLGPLGSQNLGLVTVNRVSGSSILIESTGNEGINRYWEVLPSNQPTAPINVTLSWVADDDNGKNLTKARVWKTEGNDATTFYDVSKADQDASNHSITATVSSFSIFTVSDQNNPLPVELLAFEVTKKGSTALLTWQTATEKNNQGFAVEVSTNAQLYKEVGFVESPHSNSSVVQNYTFTHRIGQAGTFYYRLKQTDWNGTTKYFGPKALTFDQVIPALSVYPNPVTSNTPALSVLIGSSEPESAAVTITDVLGKVVYSKSILVGPTHNEVKVDLSNQAAGVYIIRVISPSTGTNQTRIVKQ
ncbi:choice-of-anchor D domain-containing protein [Adhaeribacter swui]|uniref:Choice-of-anchor D domain-containing protein n=1 Tax=Adhaeribacter swui TaxID=2086471 RepID=A0A7G7G617_9BACT|nr:choice-of-anchor D domain-containing protein [Adhaeribacter swui]QNF32601.1 choice-of-anchor D domain-containing protein [Adhaeribacter swui]